MEKVNLKNFLTPSLNSKFTLLFKDYYSYYLNPLNKRQDICKDLKNKSGIYCWFNNLNGKFYIGSGISLQNRINDYFQPSYLLKKSNLIIVRSIIKYGMDNFILIILEECESNTENLLEREQFYLDKFKPDYNILTIAGNSLGYQHSKESIEKIRQKALGRKHSLIVRKLMSENRKGENSSFFGKKHSEESLEKLRSVQRNRLKDPRTGYKVTITDIISNNTITFDSIRKAAKYLETNPSTLLSREKRSTIKPYKRRYNILIERV